MDDTIDEIVGNHRVEDAAIQFVIEFERSQGREARDTRHRGAPADIESGDRLIEVKAAGRSARGSDLWLEVRQVDEARANPNFFVYVVDNVRQGDPAQFGLVILGGEALASLVARAKEKRYYEVPFHVVDYDRNKVSTASRVRPLDHVPRLTKRLPAIGAGRAGVWGSRLCGGVGVNCLAVTGATFWIGNRPATYLCYRGWVLLGSPDRRRPVWTIATAKQVGRHYELRGRKSLAAAWRAEVL